MLTLKFFQNDDDAWVGELLEPIPASDTHRAGYMSLLSTTHPLTIAAALYAMGENRVRIEFEGRSCVLPFPVGTCSFGDVLLSLGMARWISAFVGFSDFDFSNPEEPGGAVDIHFRIAVYHLPKERIVNWPVGPAPANFKRELEQRNQYIYYPEC
jgi:hypothetical protein